MSTRIRTDVRLICLSQGSGHSSVRACMGRGQLNPWRFGTHHRRLDGLLRLPVVRTLGAHVLGFAPDAPGKD